MAPRLGEDDIYPDLPGVWFNHAAVAPLSSVGRDRLLRLAHAYARDGVQALLQQAALREGLRGKLARLLDAERPDEIGFVPNTSRGIADLALAFPWSAGDRVLTFHGEFPANVTPWQMAARTFGLQLELLDLDPIAKEADVDVLEAELAKGARVVALSAVQFDTGLAMPLYTIGELCEEYGALLVVDGIQACGIVPIDVRDMNIAALSCGGHKWMMGTEGAGFLYVRSDVARTLTARTAGWTSHVDAFRFLTEGEGHLRYDRALREDAAVFEGGTQNAYGYAVLDASVDLLLALDVEEVFSHVQGILDPLEEGLVERGFRAYRAMLPQLRSGILAVDPPRGVDVVALQRGLSERGIGCAIPNGKLRFSPHWHNRADQVAQVLAAIDELR